MLEEAAATWQSPASRRLRGFLHLDTFPHSLPHGGGSDIAAMSWHAS